MHFGKNVPFLVLDIIFGRIAPGHLQNKLNPLWCKISSKYFRVQSNVVEKIEVLSDKIRSEDFDDFVDENKEIIKLMGMKKEVIANKDEHSGLEEGTEGTLTYVNVF